MMIQHNHVQQFNKLWNPLRLKCKRNSKSNKLQADWREKRNNNSKHQKEREKNETRIDYYQKRHSVRKLTARQTIQSNAIQTLRVPMQPPCYALLSYITSSAEPFLSC